MSNLKMIRKKKNLTVAELARRSGVHPVKISQIESGKIDIRNCTLQNALRLACALECRPEDLVEKSIYIEDGN